MNARYPLGGLSMRHLLGALAISVVCVTVPGFYAVADESVEKPAVVPAPNATSAVKAVPAANPEPSANSETPATAVPPTVQPEAKPSDAPEPVVIDYNEADIQSVL